MYSYPYPIPCKTISRIKRIIKDTSKPLSTSLTLWIVLAADVSVPWIAFERYTSSMMIIKTTKRKYKTNSSI